MSGFAVEPLRLGEPAWRCDAAADVLEAVASSVVALDVPTGRPDSEVAAVLTLQQLGVAVQVRAGRLRDHAEALRSARDGYCTAERRAAGR